MCCFVLDISWTTLKSSQLHLLLQLGPSSASHRCNRVSSCSSTDLSLPALCSPDAQRRSAPREPVGTVNPDAGLWALLPACETDLDRQRRRPDGWNLPPLSSGWIVLSCISSKDCLEKRQAFHFIHTLFSWFCYYLPVFSCISLNFLKMIILSSLLDGRPSFLWG